MLKQTTEDAQQPLPFDDEAHEPIAYVLTAAAHREVASAGVPALHAVDDAVDERDTRPARARALRRGGISIDEIAVRLGVDELIVRGWIDDGASSPRTMVTRHFIAPLARVAPVVAGSEPDRRDAHADHRISGAAARTAAADDARQRLGTDAGFAAGVGLVCGTGEFDDTGFTIRLVSPEVATRTMRWLGTYAEVGSETVRVVLRLGSRAAGDLARHRWSSALGLPNGRVSVVRSRQLVDPHSIQALLRVVDPAAAATLAGWCDALLSPDEDPIDLAF